MKIRLYPGKRFLGGILTCAVLASPALRPAASHAATLLPVTTPSGTTMHETYRVMTTGLRIPGSGITTIILMKGGKDTLAAPRAIPGTTPETAYAFLFWDIDGHLYTHQTATFAAPARQSSFAATAWYILTGGGSGPTAVTTFGFSLLKDQPLPGTPIASVAPSSAWTAPSTSVSTTTAVTITAANPVTFVRWLAPSATATGTRLAVGAGVSTLAIAFYGPNPCQSIQNQLAGLSPADFPPPNPVKEEQALAHALAAELRACEASHGGAA